MLLGLVPEYNEVKRKAFLSMRPLVYFAWRENYFFFSQSFARRGTALRQVWHSYLPLEEVLYNTSLYISQGKSVRTLSQYEEECDFSLLLQGLKALMLPVREKSQQRNWETVTKWISKSYTAVAKLMVTKDKIFTASKTTRAVVCPVWQASRVFSSSEF